MPDWRNPADYDYTLHLDAGQWAWEFLRRNPEYRDDWQWFHRTWQALEAEYGRPPDRDFQRWQRDARAWRAQDEPADTPAARCLADDSDKVLIECWMGSKWGFYKFPLDPATDMPVIGAQLDWRPVPFSARRVRADTTAFPDSPGGAGTTLALGFDLTLPLRPQLEAAKNYLISQQLALRKQGVAVPHTVSNRAAHWTWCLRAADAVSTGAAPDVIAAVLFPESSDSGAELQALLHEAGELLHGGYRAILRLADNQNGGP